MNYWQVAAGDGGRDYHKVFLRYGVMLIGMGGRGDYRTNKGDYEGYQSNDIKYFCDADEDDIVVLKRPSGKLWEILAVGTIRGEYDFVPTFDDVEGWHLQHCRHVEWVKPRDNRPIPGLSRGTFRGVNKQSTIQTIRKMLESGEPIPSSPIPEAVAELADEDLIDVLIDYGLRPKDAEEFTQTIHRIRRLVKWYERYGMRIKEHETRTFLIIPLLLTLGWTEQKLKIEWNNIDIAFFEKPYIEGSRESNECIMILETKRLWEGLSYGTSQAETYATKYPKCSKLIVSDGCCYKLFCREGNTWNYSAYLNLLHPKRKHPLEANVGGAPDVFLGLMAR